MEERNLIKANCKCIAWGERESEKGQTQGIDANITTTYHSLTLDLRYGCSQHNTDWF